MTDKTPAQEVDVAEVARLQKLVDAYRLAAVNAGWNWRMVDAYGHAEYARQRIEEVDRMAAGTVASGYDAAAYLRHHLTGEQNDG